MSATGGGDVIGNPKALCIDCLSYRPMPDAIENLEHYTLNSGLIPMQVQKYLGIELTADSQENKQILHEISFEARPGKITGILGCENAALKSLVDLINGQRRYGHYSGDIYMTDFAVTDDENNSKTWHSYLSSSGRNGVGNAPEGSGTYFDNIAYVRSKTLYLAGLTYLDMVEYSSRVRLSQRNVSSHRMNAIDTLKLVGLGDKLNILCPGEAESHENIRGRLGYDLCMLSLAIELVSAAPVIVLDNPFCHIDMNYAYEYLNVIKGLAKQGHTIVLSLPSSKVDSIIFEALDSIVLLSGGRSIYASERTQIEEYFCSTSLGYEIQPGIELVNFILDISTGIERPRGERNALDSEFLKDHFNKSAIGKSGLMTSQSSIPSNAQIYSIEVRRSHRATWKDTLTILERSFYVKTKEFEALRRGIGSSILVGCVVGYLLFSQGNNFSSCYDYTHIDIENPSLPAPLALDIPNIVPYAEVANLTSSFFLIAAIAFVQPVFNCHFLVQKLAVYEYELEYCRPVVFFLSTLISEAVFTSLGAWILASIVYGMTFMGSTPGDCLFYSSVINLTALLGATTLLWLAALIRREFAVRDIYLIGIFAMCAISGFPFLLPNITDYIDDPISKLNPMRWVFEALMNWKFNLDCSDANKYLGTFGMNDFNHTDIFGIMGRFLLLAVILFLITVIPLPSRLQKLKEKLPPRMTSGSFSGRDPLKDRDSDGLPLKVAKEYEEQQSQLRSGRNSHQEPPRPVIFSKESSMTGSNKSLSISYSNTGQEEQNLQMNVVFNDITLVTKGKVIEGGVETSQKKYVLNNVNGRCTWGKLTAIMGPSRSGKSSLIKVLAGVITRKNNEMTGLVTYNNKPINYNLEPWERCAFVRTGGETEVTRDLSVRDVVTFAMYLRCKSRKAVEMVDENVNRTLAILNLSEMGNRRTKFLSPGELRVLTIAEEIVSGSAVVFVDEPLKDLSMKEQSIVMGAFREMVNQGKTVCITLHEPSNEVFQLCDHLLLLSGGSSGGGSLVYSGSVKDAVNHFSAIASQEFTNNNPVTFLLEVAESAVVSSYQEFKKNSNNMNSTSNNGMNSKMSSKDLMNPLIEGSTHEMVDCMVDDLLGKNKVEGMELPPFGFYKARIVLYRACKTLLARRKLLVGAIALQVITALLFGWILGDTDGVIYNTACFFAISILISALTNVQFVYFMFCNNKVFLKESRRGLTNGLVYWFVSSLPLYAFRAFLAFVNGSIAYTMINLGNNDDSVANFYFLNYIVSNLAAFALCEAVILAMSSHLREVYLTLPMTIFVQFYLSSIPVKPSTLPSWMAPWAPSISLIRWGTQAAFINEFEDQTCDASTSLALGDAPTCPFPYIVVDAYGINVKTYHIFLNFFGWGGKTKWYCLYMSLVFIGVFRVITLVITLWKERQQKKEIL